MKEQWTGTHYVHDSVHQSVTCGQAVVTCTYNTFNLHYMLHAFSTCLQLSIHGWFGSFFCHMIMDF